jgi:hypothetical protein
VHAETLYQLVMQMFGISHPVTLGMHAGRQLENELSVAGMHVDPPTHTFAVAGVQEAYSADTYVVERR